MITARFRAKKESDIYYYADGTHPTHNTRSTYAWIKKGKRLEQQPTVSGRARVNINGLLNAYDVTDVIAHECPSVNADSTIALYKAALEKHPEAESIYVITDNACYYLSKKLREWGGWHENQADLPTALFSEFKPDRAAVEVPPKEDHQHEVLSDKT